MKLNKIVCLAVLCSVGSRMTAQETYPFRNPQLSVEQRVDDLVSRLTLEEKVKQMLNSTLPLTVWVFLLITGGTNVCMVSVVPNIMSPYSHKPSAWLLPGMMH